MKKLGFETHDSTRNDFSNRFLLSAIEIPQVYRSGQQNYDKSPFSGVQKTVLLPTFQIGSHVNSAVANASLDDFARIHDMPFALEKACML